MIRPDGSKYILDGPDNQFRCFSASQEVIFPGLYNQRKHNSDTMHAVIMNSVSFVPPIARIIIQSLPTKANVIRIHIGGDFKVQAEFDAWMMVAKYSPQKLFYAYTKSLPFWIKRLGETPRNFVLTASAGGHKDKLIREYGLRHATVVDTPGTAWLLRQEIDHDDSHAADPISKDNFCLLVHGPQKAGTYRSTASYNNRGQYV
jgi:hypothetical protein